ncbi:hypothetical protein K432DRAFT_115587 [Lepidopterella palustris CBS 459.81]|uniref:DUF6594 domain-containing protein n=1 Tax=Lepidopterella palustris CBS 459.81 TaxID=1314670 RepID=A0A8E2JJ75_9PEZI|nr:hypothetical protein K432DRAFT_115587 [Lepidopterella palustris CBS 459.81]
MVIDVDPEKRTVGPGRSSPDSASSTSNAEKITGTLSITRAAGQPRRSASSFWLSKLRPIRIWWEGYDDGWPDGRFKTMKTERIDDFPMGYPQFAAFVNSDANFSVHRRFGTLRNRIILHREQELANLEVELNELDTEDANKKNGRIHSVMGDQADGQSRRPALIDKIDQKLMHYDELLAHERASMAMPRPTKRNYRSILNYVWNNKPIVRGEVEYLTHADDFVILSNEQDSNFHAFLERLLPTCRSAWFLRLFSTEEQREKTKDPFVRLISKRRLNILIRLLVAIATVALLMIPVCLLFELRTSDKMKIVIVLIFVLLFPVMISIFAKPRNHELVAAIAAYTAVLVVFLSNLPPNGNPASATTKGGPSGR